MKKRRRQIIEREQPNKKILFLKYLIASYFAVSCLIVILSSFMPSIRVIYICSIVGIITSGICDGLGMVKNKKIPAGIVILGMLFAITMIFFRPFLRGFSGFANSLIELFNSRFKTDGMYINMPAPSELDSGLFFIIIVSAVGVAAEKLIEYDKFYILGGLLFAAFEFTMILKVSINILPFVILMVSFGACWTLSVTYSRRSIKNMVFICLTVLVSSLLMLGLLSNFKGSRAIDRLKNNIVDTCHNIRYGDDILPDGDMSKVQHMYDDNKVRLITDNRTVFGEDMYLYGFIGADYDGYSKWSEHSDESGTDEWNGIFKWLGSEGFVPQTRYTKSITSRNDEGINNVKVTNINADRSRLYIPFTLVNITKGDYSYNNDLNIKGSGIMGTSEYEFRYKVDENFENALISYSTHDKAENESDADDVYNAYVQGVYTKIDDDDKVLMDEVFFDTEYINKNSGLYSTISRIRAVLELGHSYDSNSEPYYGNVDFARWFLRSGVNGSSPYFATIGTLALRAAGYPARYAEGYYMPSDNKSHTEITSEDGHAWSEVYINNFGWVPVEFTPGYYNQSLLNRQTVEISSDNAPGQNDNSNSYQMSEQYREKVTDDEGKKDRLTRTMDIIIKITILAVLLGGSVLFIFVRKTIIENKRKKEMKSDEPERCIYSYIFKMLRLGGVVCDSSRPLECIDDVTKEFKGIRPEEYKRMVSLMQKNIFGEMPLEKREIHALRSFCAKLRRLLYRKNSKFRKIKLRFIDVV